MANAQNQILIKSKSGQIKTVNLNVPQPVFKNSQTVSSKITPTTDKPADFLQKEEKISAPLLEEKKVVASSLNLINKEMAMPGFYFHREDEEEVAQFKNKDELANQKKKDIVLSYLVEEIIKKSQLNLDLGAKDRLSRIIESRLREIRDLIETKEALLKPRNSGGPGLDVNQAKEILKIIEKYHLKIFNGQDMQAEIVSEKKNAIVEKKEPEIPTAEKLISNKDPIKDSVLTNIFKTPTPPVNIPTSQEIIAPKIIQKVINPQAAPEVAPKSGFSNWLHQNNHQENYQPRMVVGPLEELATMNLNYFRQLGSTPKEITSKIKSKIDLLTKDSFEKRMEGIKSWRQSPVYRNYLAIGGLSVESGQSVLEVIKQKQLANELCLTNEEFEAVADLNQEISY